MNSDIKKIKKAADDLRNSAQIDKAIQKYQEIISLVKNSEKGEEVWLKGFCYQMIGVSHKIRNDLQNAIKNLEKAAKVFETIGSDIDLGNVYRDIGIAYEYQKKYDSAIIWLKKSGEKLYGTEDHSAYGITLAKIGLVYTKLRKLDTAEQYLEKAIDEIHKKPHWFFELTAHLHFAALYIEKEKWQNALNYARMGLGMLVENNELTEHSRRAAQFLGLIGYALLQLEQVENSIPVYVRALEILSKIKKKARGIVYEDIYLEKFLLKLEERKEEEYIRLKKFV